jgi:hypothetical protein
MENLPKHIEPFNLEFDFWEFYVNFTCPNCQRKVRFCDQTQPYECECGKKFAVCMDVIEYGR